MTVLAAGVAAEMSAAILPVELGFEYGNGLTLSELSEIEGSHVLNSCVDQDEYATADHSPMPGYSGKHGYPGSFTSVGGYYFQIKTRVESDWYDIAVEKGASGQPTEGVSLEEGKSLYVDFLADLTTFDDDPTISFQQTLRVANSLNVIRVVARRGCLVSIDRNIYLFRHELLDDWDEPIATNWCVVAADWTGATPVRKLYELTHPDGSAFPANEDGFDRITVQATRPTGESCLVYRVFINGQPTAAAGGVTAFSSLNAGFAAPTAVRVVGFSGRGKVDDFVVSAAPPSFLGDTWIEKGRIKVVPGSWPHVAYDQCPDVDFAVDRYGQSGWDVFFHGSYARGYVVPAAGSIVGGALFRGANYEATGTGETFTFAFHYDSKSEPSPKYPEYWGWVTLGTDARGDLVVLDSAVCEKPDVLVAGVDVASGRGEVIEARPHISLWKVADHGGWMELEAGCIPRETEGLVVIPRAIDGKPVRWIGKWAFAGCSRITGVRIPDEVQKIDEGAFDSCWALQSVNLPSGLEEIGDVAFAGCEGLLSLTLPSGIGVIGRWAFPKETSLVVHVPSRESDRIVRLMCYDPSKPGDAFDPYVTIAIDPTDDERAAGKPEWRFHVTDGEIALGCEKWKMTAIPTGVAGALEIPSELAGLKVAAIASCAFEGCEGVASVKIPASVRRIGYEAFAGCKNVLEVKVPVGIADFPMPLFRDSPNIVSATLPGGKWTVGDFLSHPDALRFLSVAEGSVFIGENEFGCCYRLQSVTLPSTLRSIGPRAFYGCDELRQVSLPEGLLEVGEDAFYGCKGIRALHVPGSVAVVDDWAFRGLYDLKALSLGEGVSIIGVGAFAECSSLERVDFPSTLQIIDRNAFEASYGIRELRLPEGLMLVDDGAFRCKDVTTVAVPSTLLYVGYRAFDFGTETAVRVARGDVSRVSRLFKDAEIEFEVGQIIEEGQLTRSEKVELANQLVAETITTEFMQDFSALPPGETVTVTMLDALPGLAYALGVSATIEGLAEAVQNAPKAVATAEGVMLTVVKPVGSSAFFRMAVGEP